MNTNSNIANLSVEMYLLIQLQKKTLTAKFFTAPRKSSSEPRKHKNHSRRKKKKDFFLEKKYEKKKIVSDLFYWECQLPISTSLKFSRNVIMRDQFCTFFGPRYIGQSSDGDIARVNLQKLAAKAS